MIFRSLVRQMGKHSEGYLRRSVIFPSDILIAYSKKDRPTRYVPLKAVKLIAESSVMCLRCRLDKDVTVHAITR